MIQRNFLIRLLCIGLLSLFVAVQVGIAQEEQSLPEEPIADEQPPEKGGLTPADVAKCTKGCGGMCKASEKILLSDPPDIEKCKEGSLSKCDKDFEKPLLSIEAENKKCKEDGDSQCWWAVKPEFSSQKSKLNCDRECRKKCGGDIGGYDPAVFECRKKCTPMCDEQAKRQDSSAQAKYQSCKNTKLAECDEKSKNARSIVQKEITKCKENAQRECKLEDESKKKALEEVGDCVEKKCKPHCEGKIKEPVCVGLLCYDAGQQPEKRKRYKGQLAQCSGEWIFPWAEALVRTPTEITIYKVTHVKIGGLGGPNATIGVSVGNKPGKIINAGVSKSVTVGVGETMMVSAGSEGSGSWKVVGRCVNIEEETVKCDGDLVSAEKPWERKPFKSTAYKVTHVKIEGITKPNATIEVMVGDELKAVLYPGDSEEKVTIKAGQSIRILPDEEGKVVGRCVKVEQLQPPSQESPSSQ